MAKDIDVRLLEEAMEALPEAIAIFDEEDRFVFWNSKFREIYGPGVTLRAGTRFADHLRASIRHGIVPAAIGREEDWIAERMARFAAAEGAYEHRLADGRCMRVQDRRLSNGGRIGIRADVTALADRESTARLLLEANPAPVLVCDRATERVLWVNKAAVRFYGYATDVFLTLTINDLRAELSSGAIEAPTDPARPSDYDAEPCLHRTASGEHRTVKVTANRIVFDGQQSMLVSVFDMTEQHRMQEEVRQARNFLHQVVDHIPTAVFAKDMAEDGRFVIYNRASEKLFGRSSAEALGRHDGEVFGVEQAESFRLQDHVALILGSVETVEDELIQLPDGSVRQVQTRKVALADGPNQRPRFVIGVSEDMTDRRANEARVAHMAHHDGLTDLPNRFLFDDRLASALARARSAHELLAVLFIDLDGFKAVNDTWGHAAGDRLLQAVSDRLRENLRSCDTASRFGGDEFAVLQAPIVDDDEAVRLANRLVEVLGTPYALGPVDLRVSASIGVSFARPPSIAPATLLEQADAALYRAKRGGRNTFRLASLSPDNGAAALNAVAARMRRNDEGGGVIPAPAKREHREA